MRVIKKSLLYGTAVLLIFAVGAWAQFVGDALGHYVQGVTASGTALAGNPVLVAGSDGVNARNITVGSLSDSVAATGMINNVQAGQVSSTNVLTLPAFEQNAILNAVGATTTQIVAAVAAQRVRIGSIVVDQTATTCTSCTWKLVQGTGTNCATGQTDLTTTIGVTQASTTTGVEFSVNYPGAGLRTVSGNAVCVTGAGTTPSLNTQITFSQY